MGTNAIKKAEKMADKLCSSLRTWWGGEDIQIIRFGAYFIITAQIRGGQRALLFADGYKGKMSRDMSNYSEEIYARMCDLGRTYQQLDVLTN